MRSSAMRILLLLASLVVAVSACGNDNGPAEPAGAEPRRYADYLPPTDASGDDQCDRPVDQRTDGWFCFEPSPSEE